MITYTPILKLKNGEITALSEMSEDKKKHILPVLEVVCSSPRKDARDKSLDVKIASIVDKFINSKLPDFPEWLLQARGSLPFILDFKGVDIQDDLRSTALNFLLEKAHEKNQNVIVSISPSDSEEFKGMVFDLIQKYNFGLCIRIIKPDLNNIEELNLKLRNILANSKQEVASVDLLVDIKEEQDDEKYTQYFNAAQEIVFLGEWRNFIFSNGAFPASMGGLKSGKEHDLSRTDLIRFNAAKIKTGIVRVPSYADYSMRHPIYDPISEQHSPSPSIKYATESNWHILKGADNDYGHYFVNSLALTLSDRYYGEQHCWGDKMIKDKADKSVDYLKKRKAAGGTKIQAKGAGSSEDWIAIGVSHHIALTLDQLSN